jgi:uncharacterized protein YaaR (DUF327 family)
MIEITPHSAPADRNPGGKKTARGTRHKGDASFEQILSTAVEKETEKGIDSLMTDLRDQERRFLDSQSFAELQKYKLLLKKILSLVMDESYETVSLQRRRRDRADFLIVNQINGKIDELTRALATPENRAFALMKAIEEIRGLLCDLVY